MRPSRSLVSLAFGFFGALSVPALGQEQVQAYFLAGPAELISLHFPLERVQSRIPLAVPVDAIALDGEGRLFAADPAGDRLLLLDRETGEATPVGPFGRNLVQVVGMTFDGAGGLWLAACEGLCPGLPSLYRADPASGEVALVAALAEPVEGLAAVGEAVFAAAAFRRYRVDTATGSLTQLGPGISPGYHIRALASDGRRIWSRAVGPGGLVLVNAFSPVDGATLVGLSTFSFSEVTGMALVPPRSPFPEPRANRVINGSFHRDLLGWSLLDSVDMIRWIAQDVEGLTHSGSADLLISFLQVGGVSIATQQCLSAPAAVQVSAGGRINIPGPGVPGHALIVLDFYANPVCGGASIAQVSTPPLTLEDGVDVWHRVALPRVPVPAGAQSVSVRLLVGNVGRNPMRALFDDVYLVELSACEPDADTLCLDDEPGDRRFAAEIAFATGQDGGRSGRATALPLAGVGLDRGGAFWFFAPTNPEALLKVLPGCDVTRHHWVFYSATTNVSLEVTVVDTETGEVFLRGNPDRNVAIPVADTEALPCR